MFVFLTVFGLYLIAVIGVSIFAARGESEEEYLIAGRNRPWWQIAFSKYAVNIGAAWYVTYTALSYEYGLNILTLLAGIAAGYYFFAYWAAPRIQKLSSEAGGFYTTGDVVKYATGSVHGSDIVNAVLFFATLLYLALGMVAGGVLMESFGVISYEIAIVLTFLVVVGYVLFSGYKAVIMTDVIQGIVMLALLVLVVFGFKDAAQVSVATLLESRPIDALTVFIFGVLGVALTFSSPDRYQLSYAGGSGKVLRKGFSAAFIPVLLTAFALMYIGTVMYEVAPNLPGSLVFPEALSRFLSPELAPYALVMFFAGLMSTADSNIYALATHLQSIRKRKLAKKTLRKMIVAIGMLGLLLSVIFRDVVDLTILAAGISTSVAFPMLYLVAGGKDRYYFLYSVYGGLAGVVVGLAQYGLDPKAAIFVLIGNVLGALMAFAFRK